MDDMLSAKVVWVRLVDNGDGCESLEVDFEGMGAYEAWAALKWGAKLIEETRLSVDAEDIEED